MHLQAFRDCEEEQTQPGPLSGNHATKPARCPNYSMPLINRADQTKDKVHHGLGGSWFWMTQTAVLTGIWVNQTELPVTKWSERNSTVTSIWLPRSFTHPSFGNCTTTLLYWAQSPMNA